ncbi:MAG: roadblock/LC7 domain-containing protein [Acidobacteriota bacterium]
MEISNFRLESEEYEKILFILSSLQQKSNASSIFLINRNGQQIAQEGVADGLDVQSLSSLAASNLAATFGLARLIGEREFERVYHKGDKRSILINPIGEYAFLLLLVEVNSENHVDPKSLNQASLILGDILRKSDERAKKAKG